jgi:hypothetical protein
MHVSVSVAFLLFVTVRVQGFVASPGQKTLPPITGRSSLTMPKQCGGTTLCPRLTHNTLHQSAVTQNDPVGHSRHGSNTIAARIIDIVTPPFRKHHRRRMIHSTALRQEYKRQQQPNFYLRFSRKYPLINNILIATFKTGAADIMAQTVVAGTPLSQLDVKRNTLFMLFGLVYSGLFLYFYQVNVFQRLFSNVEGFSQKTWGEKFSDRSGLMNLMGQTLLDLGVLVTAYLPVFYIFKASLFSGSGNVRLWFQQGWTHYLTNFAKDASDMVLCWLPVDLVCFSVPLYLRLPLRHFWSFVYTVYLSFFRGGH